MASGLTARVGHSFQDIQSPVQPFRVFGAHLACGLHAIQTNLLRLEVFESLGIPLVQILCLSLVTASTIRSAGPQARVTRLFDERAHVRFIAQLVAHGFRGFFLVGCAFVSSGLVEISNGRPSTGTGVVVSSNLGISEVYITENNIIVASKKFSDRIPGWRLLFSSASSFGGNPTDENRFTGINAFLDEVVEIVCGHLR